ncbi:MAG: MGMT family protein, partial [Gammaproteobacteria bacterium]|nr:MGMT family protein [Gammaproteobacteria bacterium]
REIELDMARLTPFQREVYAMARAIPPGQTRTYGEMALALGDAGLARAVGQALGHNPFAPVVPCHRVLAANSRSGGFSARGGVATKLRMLQIEGAQIGGEPGLFDGDGA